MAGIPFLLMLVVVAGLGVLGYLLLAALGVSIPIALYRERLTTQMRSRHEEQEDQNEAYATRHKLVYVRKPFDDGHP